MTLIATPHVTKVVTFDNNDAALVYASCSVTESDESAGGDRVSRLSTNTEGDLSKLELVLSYDTDPGLKVGDVINLSGHWQAVAQPVVAQDPAAPEPTDPDPTVPVEQPVVSTPAVDPTPAAPVDPPTPGAGSDATDPVPSDVPGEATNQAAAPAAADPTEWPDEAPAAPAADAPAATPPASF